MVPQPVTMAEVQQHLLRYRNDPVQAVNAVSVQPVEMAGWPAETEYSNDGGIRQNTQTSI
jgi:hypothetical protein